MGDYAGVMLFIFTSFMNPIVFINKYVILMPRGEFNVVGLIKYVVKWDYLYG